MIQVEWIYLSVPIWFSPQVPKEKKTGIDLPVRTIIKLNSNPKTFHFSCQSREKIEILVWNILEFTSSKLPCQDFTDGLVRGLSQGSLISNCFLAPPSGRIIPLLFVEWYFLPKNFQRCHDKPLGGTRAILLTRHAAYGMRLAAKWVSQLVNFPWISVNIRFW